MNDCRTAPETALKDRERYIVIELKNLQGIATKQEVLINELLARLTPVLLAEPPLKQEPAPSEAVCVPLADDLAAVTGDISVTNDVMENILNRLEI